MTKQIGLREEHEEAFAEAKKAVTEDFGAVDDVRLYLGEVTDTETVAILARAYTGTLEFPDDTEEELTP